MKLGRLNSTKFFTVLLITYLLISICFCVPFIADSRSQEQKDEINEDISEQASQATFTSIFGNNLFIAIMGFVPGVGIGFMGVTAYNTGLVASARNMPIVEWESSSLNLSFVFWLLNPFYILEFLCYSIMVTCGCLLLVSCIIRDRELFKQMTEFAPYCFMLVTVVLLGAAIVEFMIISI